MNSVKALQVFFIVLLIMGTNMDAFGFLGFGNSASWKEEVLLHDGSKIIVERSQTFGGYPTVESQERAVLSEEWVFPVPGTDQKVIWNVDFNYPPKGSQLMLITLGFLNGTPYIATKPAGCIAYNFWKRPNPPYIFFKFDGKEWQQITLAEFPMEFKEANVVVGGRSKPKKQAGKTLSVAKIKNENHGLEHHLLQIIREPIKVAQTT
ncbi:MAG: hypothetical protein AB1649_34865, partial [Chloroflexota bacterium]